MKPTVVSTICAAATYITFWADIFGIFRPMVGLDLFGFLVFCGSLVLFCSLDAQCLPRRGFSRCKETGVFVFLSAIFGCVSFKSAAMVVCAVGNCWLLGSPVCLSLNKKRARGGVVPLLEATRAYLGPRAQLARRTLPSNSAARPRRIADDLRGNRA